MICWMLEGAIRGSVWMGLMILIGPHNSQVTSTLSSPPLYNNTVSDVLLLVLYSSVVIIVSPRFVVGTVVVPS